MAEDLSENEKGSLANVEKRLKELHPDLFDGIPQQKKQQIIKSMVVTMHKTHSGPLPDPETLAAYSEIIPNGAQRIMLMAEKQLEHRMRMEQKVVNGQMMQSNLGQILAFLIGIASLGAATFCVINGFEWAGSILGIGGLTGLVTAFIKGREQQEKNLEEKDPRGQK